jgi:predicted tellurium resistance membrane protein TerC
LLRPEDKLAATRHRLACTIWTAARTIIVADAIMSLDNVVAIAAAAHRDVRLVIIGLLLSMPLVIFGAGLLIRVLHRFPILVVAGASLLGYIAGDLIVSDPWMIGWIGGADTPVALAGPFVVAAALAVTGLVLRWSASQGAYAPSRGDA